MLTLARLDQHISHQQYEVVDLSEIARTCARRVHALASQTEVALQMDLDECAVVIGDPAQLEQAALALVENAVKYNRREGKVILRTRVSGKSALLEVADTGIGIATEHLSHLGERFYRVDKARSRQAGGTGLGLSLVRGVAAARGGNVALKNVPVQGPHSLHALCQNGPRGG